jgi:hypothetical protein
MEKVALRQVFSQYFGFPCQFSFHRLLHVHHLTSGVGTIGELVADVPSGLSPIPGNKESRRTLVRIQSIMAQVATNNAVFMCTGIPGKYDSQLYDSSLSLRIFLQG